MHYYNEYDKSAAAWLRELITQKLIPAGEVDERSILDVHPSDLKDFVQCHFFAGIGGWSYALQLAGVPSTTRLWSGSCPCQPFSTAGRQKGNDDERHLWPAFFNLIRECRPDHVFGEQVANAIGHGWLDGISADLGSEDYACGAAVLGAHSVGAPHIRQRLYWVANNNKHERSTGQYATRIADTAGCGKSDGLAHHHHQGSQGRQCASVSECGLELPVGESGACGGLVLSNGTGREQRQSATPTTGHRNPIEPDGDVRGMAVAGHGECRRSGVQRSDGQDQTGWQQETVQPERRDEVRRTPWSESTFVQCRDGKVRRIPAEPSLFPLAHGVPGRVGLLRGSGNAIVPQTAAAFILAAEAARHDRA